MTAEHTERRTLTEIVIYPEHADRHASREFLHNVQRLKDDGHYRCWVRGVTKDLNVHHLGCEWSLANDCDFARLKQFCETFDPYGYGRLLRNVPMTSVDDIRNMLVLSRKVHIERGTGIHEISFPIWISQFTCKVDAIPEEQLQKGAVL